MPEQAILDLPVIEFEPYRDSPGRLHARCIESYGLAGFRPHPDAIFHFAASLWRYRDDQSLKQVAGLAAFFLNSLSAHVAARRRVAAVRTAMEDQGAANLRARLVEADDDLAAAQDELNELTTLLIQYVAASLDLQAYDPESAHRRLSVNLNVMGEQGWTERLERLAQALGRIEDVHVNWTSPLNEVLEDLEELKLPEPTDGQVQAPRIDGGVLQRLQTELEEYRLLAGRASARLKQVDNERHQLEDLLASSEQTQSGRTRALEEARHTLENTLADVRRRMERMETEHAAEMRTARGEIAALRAERDRLAHELLAALETSTETESSQEELIEHLESAASDRSEAAHALSALSRRLQEVQEDALTSANQTADLRTRVQELDEMLNAMRDELSRSEQRVQQAQATIEALESSAGRNGEFETILTDSEERLALTQERLADAELRADQLAGQLEDKQYELKRGQDRIEAQKRTIDSISSQLAEAETLTDEHEARIAALERENERLRRDLSDAQSRMLDAKGDVDEARDAAETARAEMQRLKDQLEEQRSKTSTVSSESLQLRSSLRDREEEAAALQAELQDTRQRLSRSEQQSEDWARRARDLEDNVEKLRAETTSATTEADRLRTELHAAREEAASGRGEAERLARESAEHQAELRKLRAELEAVRTSADSGGAHKAELRARIIELEQALAEKHEEACAARELDEERRRKLDEQLQLARARNSNAELERQTLLETLEQTQQARDVERAEWQALVEKERGVMRSDETALKQALEEAEALRQKLNDSEAFLIKRQREFERIDNQLRGLLDEVRAVADLRNDYEASEPGTARDEIASQIGRRIDSLFASAGKPVRADRRTEKLVILTVKKSEEELAAEAGKPFVATNKRVDRNDPKSSES